MTSSDANFVSNTPKYQVFVRVTGQADNIGDSLLRRGLIRALRAQGDLHLLVRALPESYVDGLGVQSEDALYTEEGEWLRAAKKAGRFGRVAFVMNAGEFQLNRGYAIQYLRYLPAILRARRSGGFAAQLGAGIRSDALRWKPIIQLVLRSMDRVGWRDAESRDALGLGGVMPDWGFDEGSPAAWLEGQGIARARPWLSVSMRGDRPFPSDQWFDLVSALAAQHGLRPRIVVQVASDTKRALEIGIRLNAEVIALQGSLHSQQETAVRAQYQDSSVVVSDRLHALVVGVTEGAIPLALVDGGSRKIAKHFAVVGATEVVVNSDKASANGAIVQLDVSDSSRRRYVSLVTDARQVIQEIADSLSDWEKASL